MLFALNEVVHGIVVKKIVGLPWFLHKSIGGVRLRKQSGSKLVRQTDRQKFKLLTQLL